jgi:hemicentin
VPPRIVGPGFRTIDSIVNQTVQIECRTTGIPTPQVSWSHDGKPLLAGPSVEMINNGSVLRISAIQSAQEGRYTCTAVNKVHNLRSFYTALVYTVPYLTRKRPLPQFSFQIGRAEADTFVQVTGVPTSES